MVAARPIILMAAAEFEVKPLAERMDRSGIATETLIVGIGAIAAARNAYAIAERTRGRPVIFVGTCGAFGAFKGLEIVVPTKVHWCPYGLRVGKTYKIAGTLAPIDLSTGDRGEDSFRRVHAICASTIATDPVLPKDFDGEDVVETLELYSVAGPVIERAKSLEVFLVITNQIGPRAHDEWAANYKLAADLTARMIGDVIIGAKMRNEA